MKNDLLKYTITISCLLSLFIIPVEGSYADGSDPLAKIRALENQAKGFLNSETVRKSEQMKPHNGGPYVYLDDHTVATQIAHHICPEETLARTVLVAHIKGSNDLYKIALEGKGMETKHLSDAPEIPFHQLIKSGSTTVMFPDEVERTFDQLCTYEGKKAGPVTKLKNELIQWTKKCQDHELQVGNSSVERCQKIKGKIIKTMSTGNRS